jgi:hypothetical protein
VGDPFRDNHSDPATANRFSTHIGLAQDALDRVERIPERIAALDKGEVVNQLLIDAFVTAFSKSWETVWEQLQEARALVAAKQRDVTGYDRAREAAGDIYLPASGKAIQLGNAVKISWRNASTKPAHDAIAALKAAMPEVVVVAQAPIEVDLRSSSKKLVEGLVAVIAAGILLLVAYGLYRAIKG